VVLTYAVDSHSAADVPEAELAKSAAEVMESRLEGQATVRLLPDHKIVVELYGDVGEGRLDDVRRRITTRGELQFRIMASPEFADHKAIIAQAKSTMENESVVKMDDEVVGRWFICDSTEFPNEEEVSQRGLVPRTSGDALQALALMNDGLDVTGDYLSAVNPDTDETGQPQVSFVFNQQCGFIFGRLTGQHVPNKSGQRYNLGIILDNVLLSAPTIESKITDRGRISGNMTVAEVNFLVDILQAGRMPCTVEEVSVTRLDE
jgi:preprotein translocase subunit SecD